MRPRHRARPMSFLMSSFAAFGSSRLPQSERRKFLVRLAPAFLRAGFWITALLAGNALSAAEPAPRTAGGLQVAARTFEISPPVGVPTSSRTGQALLKTLGTLKTTVVLLQSGDSRLCFVTSSLDVTTPDANQAVKAIVGRELGLPREAIVAATSHNHTIPIMPVKDPASWGAADSRAAADNEPNPVSRDFMLKLRAATHGLAQELMSATVEWGIAREDRFVYNRRGRRADGRTYFIREEDRQELGEDYVGTIDPDATVVLFRSGAGQPVAAIAFYTGHPVTGYNPEAMVSHGQWPQIACDALSRYLGGVPVAFFQGCAGDVNSKYLLTGTIAQTEQFGEYLGQSLIAATKSLRKSRHQDMQWTRADVGIPLAPLPGLPALEQDLASIDDFVKRGLAGDQNTLECVGMNFPKALTPPYRAALINSVRPWYLWAIEQQKVGAKTPDALPIQVVVARIGDVGYVGIPFEAFVRTGLKIKREAELPCVLTSGYTDGTYGYIPDASAVDDREYMGGFFRYYKDRPPYRAPGGDAVAEVSVPVLNRMAR